MPPKDMKYETYRKTTDLIKSRFTKIQETVNKLTSSPPPLSTVQIRQLQTLFAELKKKRADFEINFCRLLETESDETSATILAQDQDIINDLYVEISASIEVATTPDPTTPSSESSGVNPLQFPSSVISGVKLPKLN
uniref:hypothetical protein n=1 Tax=Klebsiella pneumoniae TaxID=573 RepID=UPI001C8F4BF3